MKFIYPIAAVGIAIALFYLFISPTYDALNADRARVQTISELQDKSQTLIDLRDKRVLERGVVADEEEKLAKLLPDHVDNIRLQLDMSAIAAEHFMSQRNFVVQASNDTSNLNSASGIDTGNSGVESLTFSYSLSGTYDTFREYLKDLESSLRIVDIERLTISPGENGIYDYDITVRTYWLKQ